MATAVDDAIAEDERKCRRATRLLPSRDLSQDRLSQAEVQALLNKLWPGEIVSSMPGASSEVVEADNGTVLYDSKRTAAEEQARKALLRVQVQSRHEPPPAHP